MRHLIKEKLIAIMFNRFSSYVLVAFIFACVISYIYFANTAVRTLTVLEKTKDDIQSLTVKVSEMEAKRLAVENRLSGATAKSFGFVEAQNPTFIVSKPAKTALLLKMD